MIRVTLSNTPTSSSSKVHKQTREPAANNRSNASREHRHPSDNTNIAINSNETYHKHIYYSRRHSHQQKQCHGQSAASAVRLCPTNTTPRPKTTLVTRNLRGLYGPGRQHGCTRPQVEAENQDQSVDCGRPNRRSSLDLCKPTELSPAATPRTNESRRNGQTACRPAMPDLRKQSP
jgi:hypothetical protein